MLMTVVRLPERQARELLAKPAQVHDLIHDSALPQVDLDKAWHVLHLALTGSMDGEEGPASLLLGAGESVGDEDVGVGPARVFWPSEVEAFANALADFPDDALRALDGHEELEDVYQGWKGPISEEDFEYFSGYLRALRPFVQESVGSALLVYIA